MLENNPNYTNVQIKELLIPPGPWSNSENTFCEPDCVGLTPSADLNETERKLAEVMQANLLRLFPAFKASILRDKDLSEEFVDRLTEVSRVLNFLVPSDQQYHLRVL